MTRELEAATARDARQSHPHRAAPHALPRTASHPVLHHRFCAFRQRSKRGPVSDHRTTVSTLQPALRRADQLKTRRPRTLPRGQVRGPTLFIVALAQLEAPQSPSLDVDGRDLLSGRFRPLSLCSYSSLSQPLLSKLAPVDIATEVAAATWRYLRPALTIMSPSEFQPAHLAFRNALRACNPYHRQSGA